jgi:hypothetical protein
MAIIGYFKAEPTEYILVLAPKHIDRDGTDRHNRRTVCAE